MRQKFLKTPPRSDWLNKLFGRYICPRQSEFLIPNLMCPRQTWFTKWIFFFYHTTPLDVVEGERLTNMLWQLSMLPAVSKKLSRWPRKSLSRLRKPFRRFPGAVLWNGLSCSKLTPAASLGVLTPRTKKKQNCYLTRAHWNSPGPGHCWKIKPHPGWTTFWASICCQMRLPEDQRSTEWVKRLPEVVSSALNNEVTRLIGKKPAEAIKEKPVFAKPSTPYLEPIAPNEKNSPFRECSIFVPAWRIIKWS